MEGSEKRHLEKYRRKLRGQIPEKQEAELKYICCIEIGFKGRRPTSIWSPTGSREGDAIPVPSAGPHGHIHLTLLYEEGGFQELAEIHREAGRREVFTRTQGNLVFSETPDPPGSGNREWKTAAPEPTKDTNVDKDSVVVGYNPVTGKQYMHYVMVRFRRD